jgi:hypothetical protein
MHGKPPAANGARNSEQDEQTERLSRHFSQPSERRPARERKWAACIASIMRALGTGPLRWMHR